MMSYSRSRRIGWIAVLGICTALYGVLLLQVYTVRSEVEIAERRLVQLERAKVLLETEFATRSNQIQLARWNRVDFGFVAPSAAQFVENERQLADLGSPRGIGAPAPIRVASAETGQSAPSFPELVSPITGRPADQRLLRAESEPTLAANLEEGPMRIPLSAAISGVAE